MSGRLLVLGGPTAAGKTALAMAIAARWPVRLVSADAMQVYRGLDIGTGKPSPAELARFPHDNIDVREPHEEFSAMDLADGADARLRAGEDVVVVGGTGFYLRALLIGFAPTPPVDPALRAALDASPDPYAALAAVDPTTAARLHKNDRVRVVRALEVFHLTGRPMSAVHAEHPVGEARWPARRLWVDRDELDARIDARVLQMVEQGYVAEVEGLLHRGVSRDLKPMRSLGYRWMSAHVAGEISLAEAVEATQRDTRRFAKKQRQMLRSIGGFEQVHGEALDQVLAAAAETFGPA